MQFADVNGVKLAYDIKGEGAPVFFVCGSGSTQEVLEATGNAADLRAAGFQTITFDHRGMGKSERGPEPYTVHDLVSDAAGLLDHIAAGPVRVMGISMGAWVAQELALARPDLVLRAALVCTLGRQNDFIRKNYEVVLADFAGEAPLPPAARDLYNAMQLFSPQSLSDDALAPTLLSMVSGVALERGEGFEPQMRSNMAYDNRVEALSGVRCPCQVIAFSDDLCTPARLGREVAEAIPDCRYVEIPGGGHLGVLEQREAYTSALLEFLR